MPSTPVLDRTRPRGHGAAQEAPRDAAGGPFERREAWLLSALVLVGAGLLCAWTLKIRQFGIQTDELLYVKLASNIADTLSPLPVVHGEAYVQPTPAYPLLLSPLVGLLSMPAAFDAAHALNALLMASAAVPVYLLARAIGLTARWAFLAAVLAIVTPWVTFSYFLTTEALAYPVFVWAVLAIHAAVIAGGPRADGIALAAIAIAILTRTQFVVLAGAFPVAVLLQALTDREPGQAWARTRAAVLRHRLLFGAAGCAALVLGVAAVGAGSRVVGNYHSLLEGDLMLRETVGVVPEHLALLVVGASVVPFVLGAAWSLDAVFRTSRPRERAFAILLGLTVLAVVLVTAAFNATQLGGTIQERYAFYVVPLVGIAFAASLQHIGRVAPVAVVAGAVLVVGALVRFPDAAANAYSYVTPWHAELDRRSADIADMLGVARWNATHVVRVAAVAGAAAFLLAHWVRGWRPWIAAALATLTLLAAGTQTADVLDANLASVNAWAPNQGPAVARDIARGNRDWVDDAVPDGQQVAIVPGVVGNFTETRWRWWDVEAWNRSVERSYDFAPGWVDTPFPDRALRADPVTGRLTAGGDDPVRHLVLPADDRRMEVVGRTLVLRPPLRLMEASAPVRAAWWVRGADRDGWSTAGRPVDVRVFAARPGRAMLADVQVELTSTPPIERTRRFTITGGPGGVVLPRRQVTANARLCVPAGRHADARVRIRGTSFLPSGKPVGLAVTGVRVTWPRGCEPGGDGAQRGA